MRKEVIKWQLNIDIVNGATVTVFSTDVQHYSVSLASYLQR